LTSELLAALPHETGFCVKGIPREKALYRERVAAAELFGVGSGCVNMEVFMASLADEEDSTRKLTNRQKTFARLIVEGVYSNAECARRAGYVPDSANVYASKLLNGRDYPHVLEYIEELREERERQYGVTTIGQLERLHKLSKGAEEAGQFSAAINAEKIRSALGGLTIDRRENINTIDQMSRTEILGRLEALRKQYPQAFVIDNMKDVTPNEPRTRGPVLDYIEAKPAEGSLLDED
jgi:hypothetical protein